MFRLMPMTMVYSRLALISFSTSSSYTGDNGTSVATLAVCVCVLETLQCILFACISMYLHVIVRADHVHIRSSNNPTNMEGEKKKTLKKFEDVGRWLIVLGDFRKVFGSVLRDV